jgi:hypothetical protein
MIWRMWATHGVAPTKVAYEGGRIVLGRIDLRRIDLRRIVLFS